ncbi:hypothetical protein KM043_000942 [Ampulex compressa]|nr:hypothetical protein KM043_000942 [Ampulex compressa]
MRERVEVELLAAAERSTPRSSTEGPFAAPRPRLGPPTFPIIRRDDVREACARLYRVTAPYRRPERSLRSMPKIFLGSSAAVSQLSELFELFEVLETRAALWNVRRGGERSGGALACSFASSPLHTALRQPVPRCRRIDASEEALRPGSKPLADERESLRLGAPNNSPPRSLFLIGPSFSISLRLRPKDSRQKGEKPRTGQSSSKGPLGRIGMNASNFPERCSTMGRRERTFASSGKAAGANECEKGIARITKTAILAKRDGA